MNSCRLIVSILLVCSAVGRFQCSHEISLIKDVIESSDKLTSVVAHVCWKPSKQIRMMSTLANKTRPMTVRFVNENWASVVEPRHRERLMIVADLNCPSTQQFIQKANAAKKFSFPYRWIVIGKALSESAAVTSDFQGLLLLPDADVIIAQKNDTNSYILSMIYKIHAKGEWRVEQYGTWTSANGLKKFEAVKSSISTRRKNFKGYAIKIAMVILDNKTISNLYDLSDILADTVTKSSYRQTDPIFGYLNASRKHIYSPTWGYYRNGSYGGMIAEMTIGEAELAGTVLIATQDRMEVVDFLSCPTPISIKFVFREPPLSYQDNLFLLPFKTTVWYCIGVFILVLSFILYINALWESKKLESSKKNSTDPTALKPNFGEIAILMMGAISQQGSFTELKGTLGRIVMFILFLAFLLLYSSYSASIVALLQSSSNQIRTLSDLLNSKLELGVEDTPYNRYFFPEPFAFNMNKGIGYRLVERYFHEHEKCGLQEIAYLYATKTYSTCRKNSPYKEIFKIGLFRIQEHGLSDRENRLIYARKPACQARGGSFGSVNMVDFHPVLLMYLYGIILAFLLLFVEILTHKKLHSRRGVGVITL